MTTAPSIDALIRTLRTPLAQMPRELELLPLPGPFDVSVRPPGSKSITNRVLLMAALSRGESEISGALLDADDARVMIDALRTLGATIDIEPAPEGSSAAPLVRVVGTGGALRGNCTLNLNNAGTATRFLLAAVCFADAPVIIDGNARMRQRPIGELVSMLRELGVRIDELGEPGCVPLRVHPHRPKGTTLVVPTTLSSQFVSAIMLIAPLTKEGVRIRFKGPVTSPTYITMTARILAMFQSEMRPPVEGDVDDGELFVPPNKAQKSTARFIDVEPDASGATYFWAASMLGHHASAFVPGLGFSSIQGDSRFPQVLRAMGGSVTESDAMPRGYLSPHLTQSRHGHGWVIDGPLEIDATRTDFTTMPDAAMSLAAVACFARGATVINGLRTLRVKETDRLLAMQTELAKVGVEARIFSAPFGARGDMEYLDEGIEITPPRGGIDCSPSAPRVAFDTYDDHRMAMSLAIIGLRRPNVVIRNPQCVAKTYPTFWRDWAALYESARRGGAHVDASEGC